MNLAYDPATGVNFPFNNANRGAAALARDGRRLDDSAQRALGLRSLQTAFTKRMSNRWQASATYTLSWFYNAENQPFQGLTIVPFDGGSRTWATNTACAATISVIARCSTASGRSAAASS